MKKFCGFIIFILSVVSCKKNNQAAAIVPGDYAGTFIRTIGSTDSTATIRMNFSGGRFSGESDNPRYPGICEGGYEIIGDSISFGNDCFVPGDYRNSTRLYGNYTLTVRGDSVIFSRTIGDFVYEADFYRLKKQ
jgi:hypothetical protein